MSEIMWNKTGIIYDIQRFSLHDGPGIRTIIFFKGCPLRCKWCCNPESQMKNNQIMYIKNNCIDCRKCIQVCPTGAIDLENKKIIHTKCIACGKCVEVCYANALQMIGKEITVKEVFTEIQKDSVYYKHSNGGITLSGGEALSQPEFATELLKACKNAGYNTSIETTSFASLESINKVLEYVDLVLLDIKVMNSKLHKVYTGQSNDLILNNIKHIVDTGKEVIIRIPLIPSVNDTDENISKTINFIKELQLIKEVHILPYHRLGINKYDYLGYDYLLKHKLTPEEEHIESIKDMFEKEGFICKIGG
jgi:pyruvate formate lyase activating enzyme